jgi:hypothetical protein
MVLRFPPSAASVFTEESVVIAIIAIFLVPTVNGSESVTPLYESTKAIALTLVEFTEKFFEELVTVGRVTSLPDASHSASVTVRVKAKSAVC